MNAFYLGHDKTVCRFSDALEENKTRSMSCVGDFCYEQEIPDRSCMRHLYYGQDISDLAFLHICTPHTPYCGQIIAILACETSVMGKNIADLALRYLCYGQKHCRSCMRHFYYGQDIASLECVTSVMSKTLQILRASPLLWAQHCRSCMRHLCCGRPLLWAQHCRSCMRHFCCGENIAASLACTLSVMGKDHCCNSCMRHLCYGQTIASLACVTSVMGKPLQVLHALPPLWAKTLQVLARIVWGWVGLVFIARWVSAGSTQPLGGISHQNVSILSPRIVQHLCFTWPSPSSICFPPAQVCEPKLFISLLACLACLPPFLFFPPGERVVPP